MGRPRKKDPNVEAVVTENKTLEKQLKALTKPKGLKNVEDGSNNVFTQKNLELFSLPKVDLRDNEAIIERLEQYFKIVGEYNAKPSVTGIAMALGIDRRRLWEIKTGRFHNVHGYYRNLPPESIETICKAYDFLEMMWEDYMLNGKINPVSGIFLGKNQFGYQDRTEHVLTPTQEKEEFSSKEIKARYLLEDDEE